MAFRSFLNKSSKPVVVSTGVYDKNISGMFSEEYNLVKPLVDAGWTIEAACRKHGVSLQPAEYKRLQERIAAAEQEYHYWQD